MGKQSDRSALKLLRGITAIAALGVVASCTSEPAQSEANEYQAISGPRVVSLNPCLDAILVELGAPDQVLALSHYSRDPSSSSLPQSTANQFAVTGGTAEEVMALRPDIVLASSFLSPATQFALEKSGISVETFGSPRSIEESVRQVRRIATLLDRAEAGEALVSRMTQSADPTELEPISTLLWQPGQIVPGEATLIAELLDGAGFISHSAQRGLDQADYVSLELILSDPPELLLIAGDSRGQNHPLLSALDATRVETFDPSLLYCGGPTIHSVRERLNAIRDAIEADPA